MAKDLNYFASQLNKNFGPDQLGQEFNSTYKLMLQSPAFAALLNKLSVSSGQFASNLNNRLASAGIAGGGATSGLGGIAQQAGKSAFGFADANARGDLAQNALMAAIQRLQSRQGDATQLYGNQMNKVPFWQQALGGLLGAGGQVGAAYAGRGGK